MRQDIDTGDLVQVLPARPEEFQKPLTGYVFDCKVRFLNGEETRWIRRKWLKLLSKVS